ncbi:hypothetical protein [uncultured Campylobacter sp.]|uniref:hypothetical protein n=1 Tax=uncultured Campylobacter sp. TaxID=218934 RepID=UPI00261D14C8|nr:hypothetical protein [uncultured Campylobacter sp.]
MPCSVKFGFAFKFYRQTARGHLPRSFLHKIDKIKIAGKSHLEDRNYTTSLHSLVDFETHARWLELSPIRTISPMALSFKVDVRRPQHLCKLYLSDVHLANAKNRELSGIKPP